MHDDDRPTSDGDRAHNGPPCPSCQMPTRSHCASFAAACPWLVCVNPDHVIRVRDAHVAGVAGEYRPNLLGSLAQVDGHDDTRTGIYWDAVYAADKKGKQP